MENDKSSSCTKKIYWKFSSIIILKRRLLVSQLPMVSVDSRLYTVHSNQESSLRVNLNGGGLKKLSWDVQSVCVEWVGPSNFLPR